MISFDFVWFSVSSLFVLLFSYVSELLHLEGKVKIFIASLLFAESTQKCIRNFSKITDD